ncbi:CopG family transcriptional regulator [Roseburia sp. AM23-20]|jgi:predicted DNA-binding protein|uniref:CopG family transcriptional regulator n=1 Tax=Roseburia sp. AM23-20 TaxID=2292066 RepID=UPI000E51A08C|nr:CopG family transcriptional regulator [Roseburia sp. AM23-20]RHF94943.1 CopG family transcriptional regulator [Roseburia sp. AM23-20]
MAKMGRPKLDVIKDKIVTIRMSDEEYQRLRDYSEKHQQTITETIKEGVDLLYKTRN